MKVYWNRSAPDQPLHHLMVEGSNIRDIGHRDWATVPLLCFISDCLEKAQISPMAVRAYNFSGVQGIGIANRSDFHALKGMVFEQQRLRFSQRIAVGIKSQLRNARRREKAPASLN
ncbi:pyruvate formate lyase family protein [Escherichia coli]